MSFTQRCAQTGVVRCVNFDTDADFVHAYGPPYNFNAGIQPPSGTTDFSLAVRDTTVKASGSSSLRFTIPAQSASDTSGSYYTNFSSDLATQFDGNSEFFIQWRQRFSPEFITTQYAGGGGFKQVIIGTGDKADGTKFSSCTALETVVANYQQNGFPIIYNSCTGSASHGPYDGFYEPFNTYDFKLQNGRPSPYCLYKQGPSGYFPPTGNCFGYFPNEWMTFQVRIKLGPRQGDEFKGSYVTMWMAREGKASELVVNWGPYNLTAGAPADNERFGKIWLVPYNTGKSSGTTYPIAYTWYDDLIISTKQIADPS